MFEEGLEEDKKSFYITTPIYYVNDVPHIGHAYTSLSGDIMRRFKGFRGYEARLLTGTDEHGLKIQRSAERRGVSPQELTDEISENFRQLARDMKISYDDFIRTTEQRHKQVCQEIWQRLLLKGDIYKGKYSGWYATSDEAYVDESEIIEREGKYFVESGAEVEWVEEESYFFRLSKFQDDLLKFYRDNPNFVRPQSRFNEIISFVESGLEDLSVSRTTFNWGVPVPGDEGHIMYVWLDALVNYISALGSVEEVGDLHRRFWPVDFHVVGKDISRFHAVYWPSFLMSADLPLPKGVFVHGWWTVEGQKMSKRFGNALNPSELSEEHGLDAFRYFLFREVAFGSDGNFSVKRLVERYNSDLANDYGNLCQRTLSLLFRHGEGRMPSLREITDSDREFLDKISENMERVDKLMEDFAFDQSLSLLWENLSKTNQYIDSEAPWSVLKVDKERGLVVLGVILDVLRRVSLYLLPFIPD